MYAFSKYVLKVNQVTRVIKKNLLATLFFFNVLVLETLELNIAEILC